MMLILVGYMGSGKSIIGRELAKVLNYDYVDFDDFIEIQENASIKTIFETKGEIYFRKAESKYLDKIIKLKKTIVSLGGGTPCYGNNMERILDSNESTSIYLKANIPTLSKRLFDERCKRPLIAHINTIEQLNEFIGKHLFERAAFYERSNMSIKTDDKSVEEVVESILLQLF
ncbi:shikimate kinase [Psychroserpens ponticola]|uniref:Shikimate kinase n=1 Tax=Psychroserpens ponticola TaxID=2932268 RepID=A0ABY7S1A4_9FLAO|nr:shikimate kinase [Psychroserpens ponticola]WCO02780.1 shikimate kinase [Psychroserpens ponticola]